MILAVGRIKSNHERDSHNHLVGPTANMNTGKHGEALPHDPCPHVIKKYPRVRNAHGGAFPYLSTVGKENLMNHQ